MRLSRELKTGIIVIGGILLFILGFSFLKSTPLFDDSKVFYAVYNHVGGLQPGTQVSINGLTVGAVNNIEFKDESGDLLVTFLLTAVLNSRKTVLQNFMIRALSEEKGYRLIRYLTEPLSHDQEILLKLIRSPV